MLEDCYSWLDGYCLGREKLWDFFFSDKEGDASTSLELLIALQVQQQSWVSSASGMTGSFQTEWGIAFFQGRPPAAVPWQTGNIEKPNRTPICYNVLGCPPPIMSQDRICSEQ